MTWQYLPTSLFSVAEPVAILRHNGSGDGDAFVTSKMIPMPLALSEQGSETDSCMTLRSGATSEPSMGTPGLDLWMESLRVSRANRSALPESGDQIATIETCGLIPFALLERLDQPLSSLKTLQDYSAQWIVTQRSLFDISVLFLENWPRAGMMQDGVCYPLRRWEHRIREIGSGLWPTPVSSQRGDCKSERERRSPSLVSAVNMYPTPTATPGGANHDSPSVVTGKHGINLVGAILKMYPTPNARDWKGEPGKGWSNQSSLPRAVSYPTPSATDYRTGYPADSQAGVEQRDKRSKPLRDQVAPSQKLNPDWVEWLMGWPIGWTSLSPLPIENFHDWLIKMQVVMQDYDGPLWWDYDPADIPYAPMIGEGDGEIVPRTITHRMKDRANRIKAIGNGQVPIVAAAAWQCLAYAAATTKPKGESDE